MPREGPLSQWFLISIHAPVKGATVEKAKEQAEEVNFNPRAREGRDRKIATFCAVKLNVCVNYSIKKNKKRS